MTQYLIIGDGRLAKHISFYFTNIGISFAQWSRKESTATDLKAKASQAHRILLLIRDDQIQSFVLENNFLTDPIFMQNKYLIHASGALTFPFAASAHFLNTFANTLYSIDIYKSTPIILEKNRYLFSDLFPDLQNPHFYLDANKKNLYHSLCVMSGNFTTLLWQSAYELFESELHLPKEALTVYANTIFKNILVDHNAALTGPIARGDISTIVRNLDALNSKPEQKIYYAFLNYVLEKKNQIGDLKYERLRI